MELNVIEISLYKCIIQVEEEEEEEEEESTNTFSVQYPKALRRLHLMALKEEELDGVHAVGS